MLEGVPRRGMRRGGVGEGTLKVGCRRGRVRGTFVALHHGICHAQALHFRRERTLLFWRAIRIAIAVRCANAVPEFQVLCQKCHP
jgi:hypothetical protein